MKRNLAIASGKYAMPDVEGEESHSGSYLANFGRIFASRLGSGLAARFLRGWQAPASRTVRLAMIARIEVGVRQSVALIEAEGRHILVASSAEGSASFFSLNAPEPHRQESSVEHGFSRDEDLNLLATRRAFPSGRSLAGRKTRRVRPVGRVSW